MNSDPRKAALWSLLAASAAALLPACDGGETTGPGGGGGNGGATTTTTTAGGGGTGAQGGNGGNGGVGGNGGGGNGGGGGTQTGKPDGDPCTASAECEHGFCLTQEQFGWPYGACTGACNSFVECAEGSTCGQVASNPFCLKLCATNEDCKQGKLCTDIGGAQKACLPYCTNDDECAGFGTCNVGLGQCTPAENCDLPGDENNNALTDCEDTACISTPTCQPLIAAACDAAEALPITVGQPITAMGDTTGKQSLFGGYCAGGGSGEDIRRIVVPDGFAGVLELSLLSQVGDLAIYVRDMCETDLSSQCRDEVPEGDKPEILRRGITGPKTVWAFVDGSTYGSPKAGAYSLTTTLYQAQPEAEPNNASDAANAVSTTTVASLATGTLNQATDDDDWFQIDTTLLAGNKALSFETIGNAGSACGPTLGDVNTYLEILADDGTTVLGSSEDIDSGNWCSRVTLQDMPPATYLVHVKTSPLCVPDPMGPDCAFPYGIKILVQ